MKDHPTARLQPRLSLVTLGVADMPRARKFYEALGFVTSPASQPSVTFFQLNGLALARSMAERISHTTRTSHHRHPKHRLSRA